MINKLINKIKIIFLIIFKNNFFYPMYNLRSTHTQNNGRIGSLYQFIDGVLELLGLLDPYLSSFVFAQFGFAHYRHPLLLGPLLRGLEFCSSSQSCLGWNENNLNFINFLEWVPDNKTPLTWILISNSNPRSSIKSTIQNTEYRTKRKTIIEPR